MPSALPKALHHPLLWQGGRRHHQLPTLPTGHKRLDQALPGGGWPLGALTELLVARDGVGELTLLLPTLADVCRQGGWAVFVDPPWTPYPPAMRGHGMDLDRLLVVNTQDAKASLWACEQALRGVRGGVVISWLRGGRHQAGFSHLRRLQLAARSGRKGAFLFRPAEVAGQSTPAAMRLHITADEQDLCLTVLKARGLHAGTQMRLRRPHAAAADTPGMRAEAPGGLAARRRRPLTTDRNSALKPASNSGPDAGPADDETPPGAPNVGHA